MSRPLRIHWSSNASWSGSGYGAQTLLFLHRLKALGHYVSSTFWYGLEGGTLNIGGINIYPKAGHPYGDDIAHVNARHEKSDILITLIDAWVLNPDNCGPDLRFCPWFPVDSDPIPPPVLRVISKAFRPITYSKFGVAKCQEQGLDVAYVPHGVDTGMFRPMDRKAVRAEIGWRNDMFIVGMVAANKGFPSRKAFPECLEAFKQFAAKRKDAVLYLHTTLGENGQFGGVNLPELVEQLGLKDRVLFPDQYALYRGIPADNIAKIYNALDVLMSPSHGEGFGVPILESQACGCPVITGDWTAMPEITFHGWKVAKEDARAFYRQDASYQFVAEPAAIAACLEQAYDWAQARPEADVTRMLAAAGEYDADKVTAQYWAPVLADIANRIDRANSLQRSIVGAVKVPGLQLPPFVAPVVGGAALLPSEEKEAAK